MPHDIKEKPLEDLIFLIPTIIIRVSAEVIIRKKYALHLQLLMDKVRSQNVLLNPAP
ncbi:hypothetical protein SDC9_144138 [bioreactor metagenome]|uniref:Uncharacterized protein n=1 Tax=bioreactor metagenome TaxID=1076179 RepID=A0A645E6N1_9ZZZZ